MLTAIVDLQGISSTALWLDVKNHVGPCVKVRNDQTSIALSDDSHYVP